MILSLKGLRVSGRKASPRSQKGGVSFGVGVVAVGKLGIVRGSIVQVSEVLLRPVPAVLDKWW
jgi:hypothetical protein